MSSSSKITKSSSKISRLSHFDPMRDHEASSFYINFNEDLIADEFKSSCKSHRWSSKSKFQADISNLTPSEILDLPLSYFGLCNIPSINQFMEELNISSLKQHAVNELFKIKYAMKMYPLDVNEEAMILISKTKLYRIKKYGQIKVVKDKELEDYWGKRLRLAKLGISTDPSATATTASADEDSLEKRLAALKESDTPPRSLEERLAALPGGSRSKKRRSIKRRSKKRRSKKRRGTKQRQQGIKRRRTKSRH